MTASASPVPAAESFRGQMLHYARRLTRDPHRAEDIVQEAMLRAWCRGAPEDKEHLARWLRTVVRNLAIDFLRRDCVVPTVPVDMGPGGCLDEAATDDPAELVISRVALLGALDRLRPDQRAVVAQVYLYDRPGLQAAADLGIPYGTLKSRLHHALAAMRSESLM